MIDYGRVAQPMQGPAVAAGAQDLTDRLQAMPDRCKNLPVLPAATPGAAFACQMKLTEGKAAQRRR